MSDNIMPMAWNEPGKDEKEKSIWETRGRRGGGGGNDDGPPDLDEVWNNFMRWLKRLFKQSGGGDSDGPNFNDKNIRGLIGIAVVVIVLAYVGLGFYTIAPYQQGVITRLGAYNRTVMSGLNWLPPIIDRLHKVNTENIQSSRHSGWMLTKDENIIFVEVEVQYRVMDAEAYLFNVAQPDNVLGQAADSALRQVIGDSLTEDVLTNRKQFIAESIKDQLIDTLSLYEAGFHVEAVNFKDSKPPEDVKDAFDDVTKSREDRERLKLQAEAYANTLIPEAEGMARRILAEAEAYKEQVVLAATGDAERFDLIVPGYQKAPQVTRTRMYIDAMQEVLNNTSKILISSNAANSMMYLPLDKLMEKQQASSPVIPLKKTEGGKK